MHVAANYDGAGKVVVITGANSGIGKSQTHFTQTDLNHSKAKRPRGFWRFGAAQLSCACETRNGATRPRPKFRLNIPLRS